MRHWIWGLLLGQLVAGGCGAGNNASEFEAGMAALREGHYAAAYCHWRPLADRGYAEAQYHLGWLYANGNGMNVDPQLALSWWGKAARQGHADAQFAVGLAYTTGDGVKTDLGEAVTWYLKAARQGHQDARDILARLSDDPALDLYALHPEVIGEPWFGWSMRVRGDRINLRSGPGTEYAVVTQVDQGSALRVVGRRGDWYRVQVPGGRKDTAWIYKTLVSRDNR